MTEAEVKALARGIAQALNEVMSKRIAELESRVNEKLFALATARNATPHEAQGGQQ